MKRYFIKTNNEMMAEYIGMGGSGVSGVRWASHFSWNQPLSDMGNFGGQELSEVDYKAILESTDNRGIRIYNLKCYSDLMARREEGWRRINPGLIYQEPLLFERWIHIKNIRVGISLKKVKSYKKISKGSMIIAHGRAQIVDVISYDKDDGYLFTISSGATLREDEVKFITKAVYNKYK